MAEPDWRIEIPGFGVLEGRQEAGCLHWEAEGKGGSSLGDHPLLSGGGPLVWAIGASRPAALIGRVAAEALYCFDPLRVSLTPVPLVERLRRVEELRIVAADSLFLAITENGILAVDEAGRELWRISETTYGWRFVGSQDGALWLTDVGGNLIGIDPATGEETSA